jgi:arabinogalactan oligomer/maltooligosaccharide transport system permease protein
MGVQAWLMKGFFDTIPSELDESARVDGATPAQIFWGVVLPLASPVLAVVALISFVATLNDFIIASALLQTTKNFSLAVGMQQLISGQYDQTWGPFAAGALMVAIPVAALFLFLQRWIVGGLTAGSVKG